MSMTTNYKTSIAVVLAFLCVPALLAQKHWDQVKIPAMNPIKQVQPEKYVLEPGGMVIYLMEDHALPMISATIRLGGGSFNDPGNKVGLAELTATVLRDGGSVSLPGDEMNVFLEDRAAIVEASFSQQFGMVEASMMKEDGKTVLEALFDMLRHPAFPEDKLETARSRFKSLISRRNDDNAAIAGREFNRLIYGKDSPMGREMEYAHLAAITREDLVAFHRSLFQPQNMMLGLVGDFDSGEMKAWLKQLLGDWKGDADFKKPELPKVDYGWPNQVYFADKSDVAQTELRIGHIGGRYSDEDYIAMDLFSAVLGGSNLPFAKLFNEVRTKRGLAYSAWGRWNPGYNLAGTFIMGGSTKNASTVESVKVFLETLKQMLAEDIPADELQRAKDGILSSFVFNFDSKEKVLDRAMLYDFYGYDQDFLEKYQKGIQSLTAAQVREAALRHIRPDRLIVFVSGNMEELDAPLTELGMGQPVEIDISIPEPQVAKVEASAEALAEGNAIMDEVIQAYGGAKALAAIQATRMANEVTIKMGPQEMAASQKGLTLWDRPQMINEISFPMGKAKQVLLAEGSWAMQGPQIVDLPPAQVESQIQDWNRRTHILLRNGRWAFQAMGQKQEGEDLFSVVRAVFKQDENQVVDLWIDASRRIARMTYKGKHPMTGAPVDIESRFGDFQMHDGVLFSQSSEVHMDGNPFMTGKTTEIEINPAFSDADFAKPEN